MIHHSDLMDKTYNAKFVYKIKIIVWNFIYIKRIIIIIIQT